MNAVADWSLVVAAIALAIPATLPLAAVTSPECAGRASGVALGLALLFAIGVAVMGGGAAAPSGSLGARIDVVTGVMVVVVGALGAVIVRYSLTYLQGEPGLLRCLRWLLLTLSAVTALVIANNLLVMAIAWTATSLALH
jgi:NAD(P)H-quinone oxidoreductase subunit 5